MNTLVSFNFSSLLADYFVPQEAFIIFETEDAFQSALKLGIKRYC